MNHSQMQRTSRIVLVLACVSALALLGFVFIRNLVDFPVYYAAGRSLLSGRTDLYSPDFALGRVMDYRYPPFFLVALFPLWLLPYSVAAYVWYLLSMIEIIGCVIIVRRTFQVSKLMWLAVALAVAQYFVMSLHYGNAQLLAVFLLFASLYFAHQRKDLTSAILMALAITIKLTPVLLLPYFALKKRWTMLAGVVVFLAAINIAPSAYFGFRQNNQLLKTWYEHVVASQDFHEDNGPINLSLKGELRRYLSDVDYSQRVDGDVNYPAVNFASLSRDRVVQVWTIIAAALFAGVLLMWWLPPNYDPETNRSNKSNRPNEPNNIVPVELAVMICLMLLVGPLTSKIYFVALLWPVACLASFAAYHTSRVGKLATYTLIFLAGANSVLPLLPGRSIQRLLLVLGADFYVNSLLMIALLLIAHRLASRLGAHKPFGESRIPNPSAAKTP
jgi:glycosyl transferase family 87